MALLLVGGGAAVLVARSSEDELRRLEQARDAGDRAQSNQARLNANLEAIADNLAAGATLSERSEEIHGLTVKQQRSLARLADLLRAQLDVIEQSRSTLRSSRSSSARVAAVTDQQRRLMERAVRALTTIRNNASKAGAASADLARAARYGARLAEDSRREFSTP